ncbi:sensor domain-containing diguanylate cyclase [Lacrimispora amygdalina]|uniref:sensor domain-containing diguanylate cyclase n=1 Tax=Lacrimispora amygdalina TaxID=253257 RepID=UPI000BE2463D|nr:sensor domain-containing diguanylate cyclase [Lacrimispora amygdalina]
MKKHILLLSNLIIIISIIIGFIGIVYRDTTAYQDLAEKHLENILSLANKDISSHVEDSMTKPVMVSKTMANDEFLKKWLSQEPQNAGNDTYLKQLYNYLNAYRNKYGYTTVFCISAETGNYYYQGGFNKTISESDEHDVWYYNFIKSGNEYDLEVDTNETKNDYITVFVNFRVEGSDGSLLGVIGVGLQVDSLGDTIYSYERDYGLSVHIINVMGAETSFKGSTDIFISEEELQKRVGITDSLQLKESETPIMQWYTSEGKRKCLITQYDRMLGWYLVLEMDTSSISQVFQERVKSNVFFMLVALAACIVVSTSVFINCNLRIVKIENTDELTGLPNRKEFSRRYSTILRKNGKRKKTLFMFDIDHFKNINDSYGHIFGNSVIKMVGQDLQNAINEYGIAARWGGDEFFGILLVGPDEAKQIMERFMDTLKSGEKNENYHVTISVGISEVEEDLSMEQMVKKVDEALYHSKESGRNRITIL